jgi:hypothetical protein
MEKQKESASIINKSKKIELKSGDSKKYEFEFINQTTTLRIEAKSFNEMLPEIYFNEFTLEDIKKVKFFNDEYESIDECLSEIFDRLDRNETKLEVGKDELNIIVPLYSKKYPEIRFLLKKEEKSDNVKFCELFELVKKMKAEQETEVKSLKEKIKYLEDLLKIKKETEKKNEDFNGSIVSIKCFGDNEFDDYFDTNLPDKKKIDFSFSVSCKDEKDIHLALASFMGGKKDVYGDNADDINCRIKKNKLFIDLLFKIYEEEKDEDMFTDIKNEYKLYNLFLALGQNLTIKIKAFPKIFTEEYDKEKFLEILLDTELEFENMSPQIQLFTYHFLEIIKEIYIFKKGFPKSLFTDIFMNVMNGKSTYKIPQRLINEFENDGPDFLKEIFDFFKSFFEEFPVKFARLQEFKDYKIIDYNDISFYIVSPLHKAGINFNFKIPGLNEYFDKIILEEKEKEKEQNYIKLI